MLKNIGWEIFLNAYIVKVKPPLKKPIVSHKNLDGAPEANRNRHNGDQPSQTRPKGERAANQIRHVSSLFFNQKRNAYLVRGSTLPQNEVSSGPLAVPSPKECQAAAAAYRAANRGTPKSAHIFVMNGQGCGYSLKPSASRNLIVPPGCFAVPPTGGLCLLAVGTDEETADAWIPVYPDRASARRASRRPLRKTTSVLRVVFQCDHSALK